MVGNHFSSLVLSFFHALVDVGQLFILVEVISSELIRLALYNPETERFIFAGKIPLNSHKHAIFCKQNEGQGWFKLH